MTEDENRCKALGGGLEPARGLIPAGGLSGRRSTPLPQQSTLGFRPCASVTGALRRTEQAGVDARLRPGGPPHDSCRCSVAEKYAALRQFCQQPAFSRLRPRLANAAYLSDAAGLRKLWGGPPGPQPAPWPACRRPDPVDFVGEERVQGDPRGPGGPPHNLRRSRRYAKSMRHYSSPPPSHFEIFPQHGISHRRFLQEPVSARVPTRHARVRAPPHFVVFRSTV
jgi:hypothetical protein